ncbi:MAG TPA: hypothetical protein VL990_17895 [Acidobacteriaceae bacterium]|nr:hypothetical protein [Acidobacteriaceae bacterium]
MDAVRVGAQNAVESLWKDRYHAATVDEKPCQYGMILTLFNSGTVGRPVTALRFSLHPVVPSPVTRPP